MSAVDKQETVGLIPVFAGKDVLPSWAIVDEDTYLWLNTRRWHLNQGYAMYARRIRNPEGGAGRSTRFSMHRDLMRLGPGDRRVVDHINGDKLDNRLANLRVVTAAENLQNKPSYRNSTSQYRGVSWFAARGQWRVQVMVNGFRTLVGYFDDEDEAGAAAEAFYRVNAPLRRQELVTAVERPRISHSDTPEAHLVVVNSSNPKE